MKSPLDNARPLRLSFKEGAWRLEFESLEQVSQVIFRPIVYSVEGAEAVLSALERMVEEGQLVEEAQQLIEQVTGQAAEVSFEPKDGSWVHTAVDRFGISRRESLSLPRGSVPGRDEARRQALKQNLAKMRVADRSAAKIEALEKRVADLEAKLRLLARAAPMRVPAGEDANHPSVPVPVVAPGQRPQPPPGSEGEEPPLGGGAPELLGAEAPPDEERPPLEGGAEELEAPRSEEPEAPPAEPERPRLVKMPAAKDFQATVRMLVGGDVVIKPTPPAEVVAFGETSEPYYISALVDDDGAVVGGMIADLAATVHLGGGLLMMPKDVLREQIDAGEPEPDVLESMSEVFNTTSSLINEIKGNPHIRVLPAERLDEAKFSWLSSPSVRSDLTEQGGGKIILAGR